MPEGSYLKKSQNVCLQPRAGNATEVIAHTGIENYGALGNIGLAIEVGRNRQAAGYPALRHLEVFAAGGSVAVRGAVFSYFLKQIVQEIALRTGASRRSAIKSMFAMARQR